MRGKLFLLGAFGLATNTLPYFRGEWMPLLIFAAFACIIVGICMPGDDSSFMERTFVASFGMSHSTTVR